MYMGTAQGTQHLAHTALRCNSRRQDSHRGEERKVDLIVREMRRYDMKVVGLKETKWFGCDVYDVAGSIVLTAGRAVPDSMTVSKEVKVLLGWAIDAWKAWSSRLVTVCLNIGNKESPYCILLCTHQICEERGQGQVL